MKKTIISLTLLLSIHSNAQVGIGTDTPLTTLQIKEKRNGDGTIDKSSTDGLLIPKLTKQELALKTTTTYTSNLNGTLVFVTNTDAEITGPSSSKVANVNESGFYFLNENNIWTPISGLNLDSSNDAWINNPTNTRVELATTSTGANRSTETQVYVTDNGYLGINTSSNPTKRLEINASTPNNATDVIIISNLSTTPTSLPTSTLQIDNNGNVYKKLDENIEGQILRLPLARISMNEINRNYPLRIDTNTLNAPNGANNVINTITGSSISNYNYPTTSYNFETSRINLPAGIYKIEAKIIGPFRAADPENSISVTTLVNGLEYSTQDFGSNTLGTSNQLYTGFVSTDIIKLETSASIDFIIQAKKNTFTMVGPVSLNGGSSYRSLILIQRLK